jgi:hypothetical protein
MQVLRSVIHDVRIVLRDENRRDPLKAILQILGGLAKLELWIEDDIATLVCLGVQAVDRPAVTSTVDNVRMIRMQRYRTGLASRCITPLRRRVQDVRTHERRHTNAGVVLLG